MEFELGCGPTLGPIIPFALPKLHRHCGWSTKMSSSRRGGGRCTPSRTGDDPQSEVDQLLRAAEDDLLLNLRIGSHAARSSALDPDLARRFEALKTPPPPQPLAAKTVVKGGSSGAADDGSPPSATKTMVKGGSSVAADDGEWGNVLGDDLVARFAALKGSSGTGGLDPRPEGSDLVAPHGKSSHVEVDDEEEEDGRNADEGVSKKEVDKLLQWAMDAARLDPSKSDDEDVGDGGSCEDEEDDLEMKRKVTEERNKMKGKPKKWFVF